MSSDVAPSEQEQLRRGAWSRLPRDVVRVSGPDATTYLQGQLSQDLAAVDVGDAAWSLLLAPQGKVEAWLRATHLEDDVWLLDVDPGWGAATIARLSRFLLRTDAVVAADDGWSFLAVRGPVDVDLRHPAEVTVLALPVWWRGLVGYDLLVDDDRAVQLDLPEVAPAALDVVRIECGVPALGAELTDASIPAEAGGWLIDASVSFTKGCYTGQELVARVDSRGGNVPRHLRGLVATGDGVLVVGATVRVGDDEVATVTSAGRSDALGAAVGLAVVARRVEPPAAGTVVGVDGHDVPVEIRTLPLV